jgi:uncharacterized protein YegL
MSLYLDNKTTYGRIVVQSSVVKKCRFIYVLDSSGSMIGKPLEYAYQFYNQIKEIIENRYAEKLLDSKLITFNSDSQLWNKIPRLKDIPSGSTNYISMTTLLTRVIEESKERCFIILLTDGCDTSEIK